VTFAGAHFALEPAMDVPALGLDFGTTNTVATIIGPSGAAEAFTFAHEGAALSAFRSALCFWPGDEEDRTRRHVEAGPWAIDQFVELEGDCRFIQSFKTFAASPLFNETTIYGRRYKFEDLLATFLRRLRDHAGADFPKRVIIGRPVRFAGAQPDAVLAARRYEAALRALGFDDITQVYEPAAAAYFFAQRLNQSATILVADFGGCTSDFSVVRFSPTEQGVGFEALAHTGVGIAGDTFDRRIIEQVVAPHFGKGSLYKSWDKILEVPNAYFSRFSKWNELSIMRHTRDYTELQQLARTSLQPYKIEAFLRFLDADAGYNLYRAISDTKLALSSANEASLSLHVDGVDLERPVRRADFDAWIAPDLAKIHTCVEQALTDAQLDPSGIDKVFLTGGSSFVPAVRTLFETMFGAPKIETGDQLVSIAYGLALIGREPNASRWAV
jgi:hypothetical chaperone protein